MGEPINAAKAFLNATAVARLHHYRNFSTTSKMITSPKHNGYKMSIAT